MGIVRLSERDPVGLSTDACEREGRRAWTEARAVGDGPVVLPSPWVETGANADARHSAPDQTPGYGDSTQGEEGGVTS